MERQEQARFINELVENVKADLLKNVERVPEEWDGVELRQWIADKFSDAVIKGVMRPARKREYNNTVLVNNL